MSKTIQNILLVFVCLLFVGSQVSAGEGHHHHFSGDPVKTMADIVIGLKHFPSKDERKQLNDIVAHSEDRNIKIIATALVNLRHTPKEDDKTKLAAIASDSGAASNVRLLAKIVHDISHKPSREDKQQLSALTSH